MKKTKLLNTSVVDNTGARIQPSVVIGEYNGHVSGDILDANATSSLIDEKIEGIDIEALSTLQEDVDSIKEVLGTDSEDLTDTIDTFNEIQQFLSGVDNTTTLNQMLNGKINNPSNGSVGQVLTKTANGVAWEDATGATAVQPAQMNTALEAKADKSDTYTKAEVGNLITPIDSEVIIIDGIENLPQSSDAQTNKIYRVSGTNTYSDYGWNGEKYVKLATSRNFLNQRERKAILSFARAVAYSTSNANDVYVNLENVLLNASIVSISATVVGSSTITQFSELDDVKPNIEVKATYEDGTEAEVTDYTISGELIVGVSTLTITFNNLQTTLNITVVDAFGILENNKVVVEATRASLGSGMWAWRQALNARASIKEPLPCDNMVFSTADATKYQIAVHEITSLEPKQDANNTGNLDKVSYATTQNAASWVDSAECNAVGVWLAFKKLDETDFTSEEIASALGTIFTYSKIN